MLVSTVLNIVMSWILCGISVALLLTGCYLFARLAEIVVDFISAKFLK
jgi:hypothetical protein